MKATATPTETYYNNHSQTVTMVNMNSEVAQNIVLLAFTISTDTRPPYPDQMC